MRRKNQLFWATLLFALVSVALWGLFRFYGTESAYAQQATDENSVTGYVTAATGPLADARVRVQLSLEHVNSDQDGFFTIPNLTAGEVVTVTAWAPGFYNGLTTGVVGGDPVTLELKPYFVTDNHLYNWSSFEGVEGSASCAICHTANPEWAADAHSQSATNPRFISMYMGTDIHGNRSPDPQKDSLGIPLPPDLSQPYYGPGHALDYPNRPGNCAACHTPIAAQIPNKQNCAWGGCHATTTVSRSYGVLDYAPFPVDLRGDAAEGISCEFCHKVGDVILDRETKLPYADMPGILSMRLHRPKDGQDVFFGPLDDVYRTDEPESHDTYLPLMEESAFCAGCHYGIMGGVVGNMQVTGGVLVYNSYGEWLESAYSDPETGKTCQDCHMPPVETDKETNFFVYPARFGLERDPSQVHNHRMGGASDVDFLQNSVTMTTTAQTMNDRVLVSVSITNDRVGHHVPTDSPLRHMMLIVEAKDAAGRPLSPLFGTSLPDWAGNYAGLSGKMFAKVLQDDWTGEMPTGAYWRPVTLVSDTRLAAHDTDVTAYLFALPSGVNAEDVSVETRLVFRRAYQQLQEWKAWTDPDILMEEATVRVQ